MGCATSTVVHPKSDRKVIGDVVHDDESVLRNSTLTTLSRQKSASPTTMEGLSVDVTTPHSLYRPEDDGSVKVVGALRKKGMKPYSSMTLDMQPTSETNVGLESKFIQRLIDDHRLVLDERIDVKSLPEAYATHFRLRREYDYSKPQLTRAVTKESDSLKVKETKDGQFINQYKVIGSLGSGSFGQVWLSLDTDTKLLVAVKSIPKSVLYGSRRMSQMEMSNPQSAASRILKDIDILKHVHHKNCVNLIEEINDEEQDMIYLVTEYCSKGQVMDYSEELGTYNCEWHTTTACGGIKEALVQRAITDIMHGLLYLQTKHVIHRDIKPENILVDGAGNHKLADFDTSHRFLEEESGMLPDTAGTYTFMSPQAVSGTIDEHNGYATDIWALGVTMYCLMYGRPPWYSENSIELFDTIEQAKLVIPENSIMSDNAIDVLKGLLQKDENDRLAFFRNLPSHPWIDTESAHRVHLFDVDAPMAPLIEDDQDETKSAFF